MRHFLTKIFANRSREAKHAARSERSLPDGVLVNAVPLPDAGDDTPEWIRIVPIGRFANHWEGPYEVTAEHVREMAERFAQTSTDLLFDIDHESYFWGSTRAAGWSAEVEAREDGLYCRFPAWTPYGQGYVENREYRYLSPTFSLTSVDRNGRDAGAMLHNVALTNTPFFDLGEIDAVGNTNIPPEPAETMDKKLLCQKLGLPEDATDEQINAKLDEVTAASQAPPEPEKPAQAEVPNSGTAPEGTDRESADVASLQATINSLQERLNNRDQAEAAARAEALVDGAIAAGKIFPRDRKAYLASAKADFDGTKADLDAIKPNAAMPKKLETKANQGAPGVHTGLQGTVNKSAMDYVNSFYGAPN